MCPTRVVEASSSLAASPFCSNGSNLQQSLFSSLAELVHVYEDPRSLNSLGSDFATRGDSRCWNSVCELSPTASFKTNGKERSLCGPDAGSIDIGAACQQAAGFPMRLVLIPCLHRRHIGRPCLVVRWKPMQTVMAVGRGRPRHVSDHDQEGARMPATQ